MLYDDPRAPGEAFPTTRKAAMPQRLSISADGWLTGGVDHRGQLLMDLKQHIRSIPDFPKPGILFYDISTLLAHPQAWRTTVARLAEAVRPHQPDLLVGIESRGFLVAAPLAYELGCGFAMVRKKGKLPGKTVRFTYDLEYGSDTIEIQEDAIAAGPARRRARRSVGDRRARCRRRSIWCAGKAASSPAPAASSS